MGEEAAWRTPSPAWREKGVLHPLVSVAIQGIPNNKPKTKMEVDTDWFQDGFEHTWTPAEYFAVTWIYGWMLRISEATEQANTNHTITWAMVKFKKQIPRGGMTMLTPNELRSRPCDMVELDPESRKHQEFARDIPGRMNTRHIQNPAQGVTTWQNMCQATLLQGWALMCNVDKMSLEEKAARPVLTYPGSEAKRITPLDVTNALQKQIRRTPDKQGRMTAHVLRHNGITHLANSKRSVSDQTMMATTGHASAKALATYIKTGKGMAEQTTQAMMEEQKE